MPLSATFLSLALLGHWGSPQPGNLRHISSCEDPAFKPASAALPTSLFTFVQDNSARQAAEAYNLYMQALQVNASLFSLTSPSMYGYRVPLFPSYAMPTDHYVDPQNLPQPALAWGGLMTDPKLQYLIKPTPSTSLGAASGSLNSLVDLRQIQSTASFGFSVGAGITASAVAGPSDAGSVNQELANRAAFSSKL